MRTQNEETQPQLSFGPYPLSESHRFAHNAMATTFEVFIAHPDAAYAEQSAWAAFHELDRLEHRLSCHIENSEISRINNLAAGKPLRINLKAFECLKLCLRMHVETKGAFDATVGFLLDCLRKRGKGKASPSEDKVNRALQRTGMHRMELDEIEHTVTVSDAAVRIDLGGIGKGYALDRMAALLRDWDIHAALLHGGRSSILALDSPAGTKGWPVRLTNPTNRSEPLAELSLENRALGGSGLRRGDHIIIPRTGYPVADRLAAWSSAPTAAVADALSTAFMVMSMDEIEVYCSTHPNTAGIIVTREETTADDASVHRYGSWEERGSRLPSRDSRTIHGHGNAETRPCGPENP